MAYKLAPGWNNVAGLIDLRVIVSGLPLKSHATGLGTFRAGREIEGLDGITRDDGDDAWEWAFAVLLTSDIATIEDDILDGARSGPCTAETTNRYGAFVQRNAVLTLPQTFTQRGGKYADVIFKFIKGGPAS